MNTSRYSAHEAIDNFILEEDAKNWKHVYIGDEAVPYCEIESRTICSPVMPPVIDDRADRIIRAKNEHEAGHARLTPHGKLPSWSPLKGHLVNVLEDLRIERGLRNLSAIFADDLNAANRFFIERHTAKFHSGEYNSVKPIDEAVMALHFNACGFPPCWNMKPEPKKYYDSAVQAFEKWQDADCNSKDGFTLIKSIADQIIAIWSEMKRNDNNAGKSTTEENNGIAESTKKNGTGKTDGNNETNGGDQNDKTDKKPEPAEESNGKSTEPAEESLNDDFSGTDLEENAIREEFRKIKNAAEKNFGKYRPYSKEDRTVPAKHDRTEFERSFNNIRGTAAKLSAYLQQSLRTMARTRTISNADRGTLSHNNAAIIAKSLSRNIFEYSINGISLNTAVSILVDESGSIGKSMAAEFRKLTTAFAESLERLKIKFEILGHTTEQSSLPPSQRNAFSRTERLLMLEYKSFRQNYSTEKHRLGSITARTNNIDGDALLETFRRNMEQRTKRHLILVLSDGIPCAAGNRKMLEQNLLDTVKLCRANGAEIYAFGVGTKDPEKYYGNQNFIYVPSEKGLTEEFFRKTASIIAGD